MKKVIHIFWFSVFMLCVATASADLSEVHMNALNAQLRSYCGDLALQEAQTTFDAETTVSRASITQVTCSYNPFSACEFAVECNYMLTTRSPSSGATDRHRGYRTLKIYKYKEDALNHNKSLNVYTLSVDNENYYVAHSINVLELFFID